MKRSDSPPVPKPRFLTADRWIDTARQVLLEEGVEHVKVQRLAKLLRVTRGSFYWHFKSRQHLLDELLAQWRRTNTGVLIEAIADTSRTVEDHIHALFTLWLDETEFSPRFDSAIRDWARKSQRVRDAVRAVDSERIGHIARIFADSGFPTREVHVRAMVLYYTQVGYYTVDLQESLAQRLSRTADYIAVFTGRRPSPAKHKAFLSRFGVSPGKKRKRA